MPFKLSACGPHIFHQEATAMNQVELPSIIQLKPYDSTHIFQTCCSGKDLRNRFSNKSSRSAERDAVSLPS